MLDVPELRATVLPDAVTPWRFPERQRVMIFRSAGATETGRTTSHLAIRVESAGTFHDQKKLWVRNVDPLGNCRSSFGAVVKCPDARCSENRRGQIRYKRSYAANIAG